MTQLVTLSEQEWQRVINAMSYAPWREANDLLMKIGGQLREQSVAGVVGNGPTAERRDGERLAR